MSVTARRPAAAADVTAGITVIVSCEHGGRDVPDEYRALFAGPAAARVLSSHRGFDAGAAEVAAALAARFEAPLFVATTTRLLVDLNRSLHHPRLLSEYTRALPPGDRQRLIERQYLPYRNAVETDVAEAAKLGFVLHVSAHSFTPILDGAVRNADVALLFDPRRSAEAALAAAWRASLQRALPAGALIRRNYPYRGTADGLTTHLRRRFAPDAYAGLELEVNQKHVGGPEWPAYVASLAASLERALLDRDQRGREATGRTDRCVLPPAAPAGLPGKRDRQSRGG